MINWLPIAQKLGYDSARDMWLDLYVTRQISIDKLTEKLDVSRNTVRDALDREQIPIRKRGGPNHQKFEVTDELIAHVKELGIGPVAKELGVAYTTLYKRLFQTRPRPAEPAEPDPAEEEEGSPCSRTS
jgi:hypothetical protein